jgi:hypothetical protein
VYFWKIDSITKDPGQIAVQHVWGINRMRTTSLISSESTAAKVSTHHGDFRKQVSRAESPGKLCGPGVSTGDTGETGGAC